MAGGTVQIVFRHPLRDRMVGAFPTIEIIRPGTDGWSDRANTYPFTERNARLVLSTVSGSDRLWVPDADHSIECGMWVDRWWVERY